MTLAALVAFVLVTASFPGGGAAAQEGDQGSAPDPPKINAGAWALVDTETGLYLAGKNPDKRMPIASTTKIMVALIALEDGADLDEEVAISDQAERFVGSVYSNIGLISGERLSVRELLVASLVPSGTEAVYALAEHLGGGGGKAGVENAVEEMNRKAEEMGLENTHFENPAGLDTREHYSSARDLAEITREAMEYPEFREIVDTETATISTQSRKIEVFTTNNLLYIYGPAAGVKTGTSPEAGPSLVAAAREGDEAYTAVVLDANGEQYRFEAAQTALDFGFADYEREALVREDQVYDKVGLPFRREETVGLAAAEDVPGLVGPGLEVERRTTTREPPPEAQAGQELGTIEVLVDGQSVGTSPLVTKRGYEEASLWQKIRYWSSGAASSVSGWVSGLF
ncbi:MAG TPA: D-alanyl-D-alanine carboxypeptidase family protein [Rubrobacteraceae bacterium]|nr:D-alanyl-D-alanine carboxypeptidase family protein [Rubrobacteraceae bacterium]